MASSLPDLLIAAACTISRLAGPCPTGGHGHICSGPVRAFWKRPPDIERQYEAALAVQESTHCRPWGDDSCIWLGWNCWVLLLWIRSFTAHHCGPGDQVLTQSCESVWRHQGKPLSVMPDIE